MSSQTPPNPWFNAINYNPTFFGSSTTAGVSLSYVNGNFLKSSAGSNPISNATLTTFLNSVVLGNTTILQTNANLDLYNKTNSATMTFRVNNAISSPQTVLTLTSIPATSSFQGIAYSTNNIAGNPITSGIMNLVGITNASAGIQTLNVDSTGGRLTYDSTNNILATTGSVTSNSLTIARPITSTNTTIPVAGQIGYTLAVNSSSGVLSNNIFQNVNFLILPAGMWLVSIQYTIDSNASILAGNRSVFEVSLINSGFQNNLSQVQNSVPFSLPAINGNSFATTLPLWTTGATIYGNILLAFTSGVPTVNIAMSATRIA